MEWPSNGDQNLVEEIFVKNHVFTRHLKRKSEKSMSEAGNDDSSTAKDYRPRLEDAEGYSEVWELVRDTVKSALGKHRVGMMLFLDDLPLRLGAYHP